MLHAPVIPVISFSQVGKGEQKRRRQRRGKLRSITDRAAASVWDRSGKLRSIIVRPAASVAKAPSAIRAQSAAASHRWKRELQCQAITFRVVCQALNRPFKLPFSIVACIKIFLIHSSGKSSAEVHLQHLPMMNNFVARPELMTPS